MFAETEKTDTFKQEEYFEGHLKYIDSIALIKSNQCEHPQKVITAPKTP